MIDWDSVKHFKPEEFDSRDAPGSASNVMSPHLVRTLDTMRSNLGFPLVIASGYRTPSHNEFVGGKDLSAHLSGDAADIKAFRGDTKFKIVSEAIYLGIRRIGIGKDFIHLDVSPSLPSPSIWTY